jgi:acetolactate synthase-1/3 small subunit
MSYIFSLEVRDTPGVLMRVAQVFGRRGCNIRALNVQHPTDSRWSVMTIAVDQVSYPERLQQQLEKLVDVESASVIQEDVKKIVNE